MDLCVLGDKIVTDECAKVFKSKDLEKGIAFPTCVSINSVIGHFSPLADDTTTVAAGDVVKIDLGCHINGMIATVATTVSLFIQIIGQLETSHECTAKKKKTFNFKTTSFFGINLPTEINLYVDLRR